MNKNNALTIAEAWLETFNSAVASKKNIEPLFHENSFWRNAVGLGWNIDTIKGSKNIAKTLPELAKSAKITQLRIDKKATSPRLVNRAGSYVIEAFFTFETSIAKCRGIVRLNCDELSPEKWRAWTFFTAADALIGYEEKIGNNRPRGETYSRDFCGPNWLDKRVEASLYEDNDPDVVVVGGGQAGLSIAARLVQLGVDTLIVEKNSRIGDNWRKRYHALTLHNQIHVNHLPYMPFPETWPTYIPKDMLALWFEAYVSAMEINFWTDSNVIGADYNTEDKRWLVQICQSNSKTRQLNPQHIVMATGVSGIPNKPKLAQLDSFKGQVIHSSQYSDGEDWKGRSAIVVGCGNSGHDIAQDLYSSGANVTMTQRSPSLVVNIEPSAQFPYILYEEDRSLEECDFITSSMPMPLVKKAHQHFTKKACEADLSLLKDLKKIGFKLDFGKDNTGWQFKYLSRGGGYYFNVGCSNLLAEGKIKLVQFDEFAQFYENGMTLKCGKNIEADLIVLATGYKPQEHLVAKLFGDDIADRVGPIWGFGNGMEIRNMYCKTNQQGLWFIAGSFAQCRINSKYLALQIKGTLEGLNVL